VYDPDGKVSAAYAAFTSEVLSESESADNKILKDAKEVLDNA
jgi:hypothetical protein